MARDIKIGEKFGRLTVLKKIEGVAGQRYKCKCDCGNDKVVSKYDLLNGTTKSCGCLKKDLLRKKLSYNLVGQRFGRLTVVKLARVEKHGNIWLCKCDCGNMTEVATTYLTHGDSKSCGCLKRDFGKTHGKSSTKIYHVYQAMLQRCFNPKAQEYECYGGRGITVCEEWKNDFMSFWKWSIEHGYSENKGLSIERIDNDGNYKPSNCKWATRKEQAFNRRTTHSETFNGETKCYYDWAKVLHISEGRLKRLLSLGWSMQQIVTLKEKERKLGKYLPAGLKLVNGYYRIQ